MNWIKEKWNAVVAKIKGWRTVIVGAIVGLPLAGIEILDQLKVIDWQTALPEPWGGRLALGVSLAMILLRLVTSTPVGKGEGA